MTTDLGAKLFDLRARFVTRLIEDVGQIGTLIEPSCGGDQAAIDSLEQIAHRIAGTSGSFGFPEIGLRASALEDAAAKLRNGGKDAPIHSAAADLRRALDSLPRAT